MLLLFMVTDKPNKNANVQTSYHSLVTSQFPLKILIKESSLGKTYKCCPTNERWIKH